MSWFDKVDWVDVAIAWLIVIDVAWGWRLVRRAAKSAKRAEELVNEMSASMIRSAKEVLRLRMLLEKHGIDPSHPDEPAEPVEH